MYTKDSERWADVIVLLLSQDAPHFEKLKKEYIDNWGEPECKLKA